MRDEAGLNNGCSSYVDKGQEKKQHETKGVHKLGNISADMRVQVVCIC